MELLKVIFALAALLAAAAADCNWEDLQSCLSEFLLVTSSGVKLSRQSLAKACLVREDTLLCLKDYDDQCVSTTSQELITSINKTYQFIDSICLPNSQFVQSVEEFEGCYENVSQKVQSCYSRAILPVASDDEDSKWKAECCEYNELRNCAVHSTEDACGPSASQLMHEHVSATTGVGLEMACMDLFPTCQNAAASLAAYSATLVLVFALILSSRWSLWAA